MVKLNRSISQAIPIMPWVRALDLLHLDLAAFASAPPLISVLRPLYAAHGDDSWNCSHKPACVTLPQIAFEVVCLFPVTGWSDGAQCDTSLQEEVCHHVALQAHLREDFLIWSECVNGTPSVQNIISTRSFHYVVGAGEFGALDDSSRLIWGLQ